jgi:hypothetical protein
MNVPPIHLEQRAMGHRYEAFSEFIVRVGIDILVGIESYRTVDLIHPGLRRLPNALATDVLLEQNQEMSAVKRAPALNAIA